MIKIPVNHSELSALVDDEDFYVRAWSWQLHKQGYAQAMIRSAGGLVLLHRFILQFPDYKIDHEDGNPLNCQRHNLRPATQAQNCRNKKATTGCQYKGIFYNAQGNGPYARIYVEGKHVFLGRYSTDIEAAQAYDEAALKHFGEFARLNFER